MRYGGKKVYRNLPGNWSPFLKGAVAITFVVGPRVAAGAAWAISTRLALRLSYCPEYH